MTHKIKDLVDVVPAGSRVAPSRGSNTNALSTFLLSYEIGDAVTRTVERLASGASGPHNCLVVGGAGCGKSRLLAAISAVLESDPATELHSRFAEARLAVG